MKHLRRFLAALTSALFCLTPGLAFPDSEGVRILFVSEGGNRSSWNESLAAALARSELLDVVIEASGGADAVESAARFSCALAIRVATFLKKDGQALSEWRVMDPLSRETLAEGKIEGPDPTDRELAEYWWIPLVEAAETALPKVKHTLVRVQAAPGTIISGLSEKDITVPPEGVLKLPLRVPGTYPWHSRSKGAYPEHGYFGALEQGQTLSIPYNPLRLMTVETGLMMMEFPDFWLSRRFREDSLFVRFGFFQYLLGVYLMNENYGEETSPMVVSYPLVMPGIGFGGYFLPSDAAVRPYGVITAFTRFLLLSGHWGPDPIAPLGLLTSGGLEWKAFGRTSVYIEMGATLYPFCQGFLLAASRGGDSMVGPFKALYGDHWLVELPILRFGARFTL